MNLSELFLDGARRAARKEIQDAGLATAMWATVQSVNPVRVALDKGDGTPMRVSPKSLVGGLAVGDRVWVEIAGNRAVIIGRAGGGAASSPAPTGITLSADWEIYNGVDSFVRSGGLVSTYWAFMYTGADINVSASGNIPNQTVCSVPVPLRSTLAEVPLSPGTTGRVATFSLLPSGALRLAAVAGSANITAGETFSCGGTYLSA